MSQREDAVDVRAIVSELRARSPSTKTENIVESLNRTYEWTFYSARDVVWMVAEHDHLPPIKIG